MTLTESELKRSENIDYFKNQQHIDQDVINSFATSVHTFVMDELRTHDTPSADAYDVLGASKHVTDQPPAYTIKQRYEQKEEKRVGYEYNNQCSSLSHSGGAIPSAPRDSTSGNGNPPPNEYRVGSTFNKNTGSHFPGELHHEAPVNENPAPNYYNPYTKALEVLPPAFTIRSRASSRERVDDVPFYCAHGKISGPASSFGKQDGKLVIERTPGPETYVHRPQSVSTRRYQILRRTSASAIESTPGPCEYSQELSSLSKSGAGKFGIRPSSHIYQNPVGPGQYSQFLGKRIPGGAIGKEERDRRTDQPSVGPGSYTISGKLQERDFHIMNKYADEQNDSQNPAPNNYTLAGSLKQAGTTIQRKTKAASWIEASDVPGPGKYDVPCEIQRRAPEHETFPRFHESDRLEETPAPNEYNTREKTKDGGFSMRFREYGLTL